MLKQLAKRLIIQILQFKVYIKILIKSKNNLQKPNKAYKFSPLENYIIKLYYKS